MAAACLIDVNACTLRSTLHPLSVFLSVSFCPLFSLSLLWNTVCRQRSGWSPDLLPLCPSVRLPGWLQISIPGLGVSQPFLISQEAPAQAAYHTCRALYYQRSAMPHGLQTPFAEPVFARPIDVSRSF